MTIRHIVVKTGIAVITGCALFFGGFVPAAHAEQSKNGDLDCGGTVNRTVSAWAMGARGASARVNGLGQRWDGDNGPYTARVDSDYVHAPWWTTGKPYFMLTDAACVY